MSITQLEVCNNALDLVGQGTHISSLTEASKEADLCNRLLSQVLLRSYDKYDWSFCKKDEILTQDYLVDYVSRPFNFTYSLPADVLRVLWIAPIDSDGKTDRRFNAEKHLPFEFRNVNNAKCLVTDVGAPILLRYQSNNPSFELLPPTFVEGIEFLLAGRIAMSLVKGQNGVQMGQGLMQLGYQSLTSAHDLDTPIDPEPQPNPVSSFVSARG